MSSSTPVVDSITIYPIKSYACVMQCNGRTLVTMCVMCQMWWYLGHIVASGIAWISLWYIEPTTTTTTNSSSSSSSSNNSSLDTSPSYQPINV
jgi:hypothetical protein